MPTKAENLPIVAKLLKFERYEDIDSRMIGEEFSAR